ncbi:hypothetical protein BDF22DRAFT_666719 [Syncephalis plumigaleata]|nr:hypothetical protein BDF22DRAFT_666719 [Syncephalis plumigaleata]
MLPTNQECSRVSSLLKLLLRAPFVLGDEARYQRVVDFLHHATCAKNTTCPITEQEFVAFVCKGICYEQHLNPYLLALTIQLVAYWGSTRGSEFFRRLLEQHPDVISSTVNRIDHKSAVVRMACIQAWSELVANADWAQSWLATSHMASHLVAYSLEDSSTNVMVAGCRFLAKILISTDNATLAVIRKQIIEEIDLTNALSSYLYDEGEDGDAQALVALELLWALTQTKANEAYEFLVNSQLLFRYKQLLIHPSKMVRAKFLDIIELGLDWWPEASCVFGMNSLAHAMSNNLNTISKQEFVFYDEILNGLSEASNTIEWLDAARLAMLVCSYYQSMKGGEDLSHCFYSFLWCCSTDNPDVINRQLDHSIFKGSEPYKVWLLDAMRTLPYQHVDSTRWIMAQHSAMICKQWITKFTILPDVMNETLCHFTAMASIAFDANQFQTTTIITRCITAHINKLSMSNDNCLLINHFLEKLLTTSQMDDHAILNALGCVCQLYTCPSIILPESIHNTVQSICKLAMHKRADIREISLRVMRNILNGMIERHITIMTTSIASDVQQLLAQALLNAACDDEAVVALNSIDNIKMYISMYYEQLDNSNNEALPCIKELFNPLLKHHDSSVRRVALSTALSLSHHNQDVHKHHSSIISTIIKTTSSSDHYLTTLKHRLDTVNWTQLVENTNSNVSDTSLLLEELGLVTTTNNNDDDDQWMPPAPLVDDCF